MDATTSPSAVSGLSPQQQPSCGFFKIDPAIIRNPERCAAFSLINEVLASSANRQNFEEAVAEGLKTQLLLVAEGAIKRISECTNPGPEEARLKKGLAILHRELGGKAELFQEAFRKCASDETKMELTSDALVGLVKECQVAISEVMKHPDGAEAILFQSALSMECLSGRYSTIQGRIRGGLLSNLLSGRGRFELSIPEGATWFACGKISVPLPSRAELVRDEIAVTLRNKYGASEEQCGKFIFHWNRSYRGLAKLSRTEAELAAKNTIVLPAAGKKAALFQQAEMRAESERLIEAIERQSPEVMKQLQEKLKAEQSQMRDARAERHMQNLVREVPLEFGVMLSDLSRNLKGFVNAPFRFQRLNDVVERVQLRFVDQEDLRESDVVKVELGTLRRCQHVLTPQELVTYLDEIPACHDKIDRDFKQRRARALANAAILSEINSVLPELNGRNQDHRLLARLMFSDENLSRVSDLAAAAIAGSPLAFRKSREHLHGGLRHALSREENRDLACALAGCPPGILFAHITGDWDRLAAMLQQLSALSQKPEDASHVLRLDGIREDLFKSLGIPLSC